MGLRSKSFSTILHMVYRTTLEAHNCFLLQNILPHFDWICIIREMIKFATAITASIAVLLGKVCIVEIQLCYISVNINKVPDTCSHDMSILLTSLLTFTVSLRRPYMVGQLGRGEMFRSL